MAVTFSRFNIFFIFLLRLAENYYSEIFEITEDGCKFKCWDDEYNAAAMYLYVFPWKWRDYRPVNLKTITRVCFRDFYEFD